MKLYLEAQTNIPDVVIDYIEVRLNNGEEVSLNWDESDISRSEDGFDARYKGVYFGDEYANGRIDELNGLQITDVGLYFESSGDFFFRINEMQFEDNDKELTITNPELPQDCGGLCDVSTTIPSAPQKPALFEQIQSAEARANTNQVITDLIDKDKLQAYLKEDMILEFSSAEECMEYFNTYDHQNFKSVDEMKAYQGEYGFGVAGKWYHISYDEALDVRKESSHINEAPER